MRRNLKGGSGMKMEKEQDEKLEPFDGLFIASGLRHLNPTCTSDFLCPLRSSSDFLRPSIRASLRCLHSGLRCLRLEQMSVIKNTVINAPTL
jgi:hypothetical protein